MDARGEGGVNAELVSFDKERTTRYIQQAFHSYMIDPADSDFQRGFLAALLTLYREGLGKGAGDDRLPILDAQVGASNGR